MTKAAEELSIAQPSLSKTIRRLEKEIGVPLFDRQGRSLQLNQFGKAFLEHIDTIFYKLEEGQLREVAHEAVVKQVGVTRQLSWKNIYTGLRVDASNK